MDNQERQVIADIFKRLEQVADQPRDPEAERLIAEKMRQQPYAPYAMAQAIFVQEQALANLNQRVQQLEAELEDSRGRSRQSGGLLGSLFGGGREPERPQRPMGAGLGQPGMGPGMGGRPGPWGGAQGGPWGGQPGMMGQPGAFGAQRGGSGFLGTAMATAAGVAGGMMLGSALSNAFGGGAEGGGQGLFGGDAAQASAGGQDNADLSPFGNSSGGDAGVQDASYDPSEDLGGDGGGDWA